MKLEALIIRYLQENNLYPGPYLDVKLTKKLKLMLKNSITKNADYSQSKVKSLACVNTCQDQDHPSEKPRKLRPRWLIYLSLLLLLSQKSKMI